MCVRRDYDYILILATATTYSLLHSCAKHGMIDVLLSNPGSILAKKLLHSILPWRGTAPELWHGYTSKNRMCSERQQPLAWQFPFLQNQGTVFRVCERDLSRILQPKEHRCTITVILGTCITVCVWHFVWLCAVQGPGEHPWRYWVHAEWCIHWQSCCETMMTSVILILRVRTCVPVCIYVAAFYAMLLSPMVIVINGELKY